MWSKLVVELNIGNIDVFIVPGLEILRVHQHCIIYCRVNLLISPRVKYIFLYSGQWSLTQFDYSVYLSQSFCVEYVLSIQWMHRKQPQEGP